MPRRGDIFTRPIEPDKVHNSRLVQQVINKVMADGKKSTAEKITYEALDMLSRKSGKEPVEALEHSIKVLTPVLEVRSRRVGGATYQVPVEVPARRARTLAVRWLVEFARAAARSRCPSGSRTSCSTQSEQQGDACKRKDDIYRMARPTRPSRTTAGSELTVGQRAIGWLAARSAAD